MSVNAEAYKLILAELASSGASLVAVSKTKPASDISEMYALGQRDFGENYVQELVAKQALLPDDIRWHFIGHLQSNKVKQIVPFVYLIHGVDSVRLLKEIDKAAAKAGRVVQVLLQVHIAREETKFGFSAGELNELLSDPQLPALQHIVVRGLMGMASFTEDEEKVRQEFRQLKTLFNSCQAASLPNFRCDLLSMGMSADYRMALEEGSNMVRIGSLLFGSRQ